MIWGHPSGFSNINNLAFGAQLALLAGAAHMGTPALWVAAWALIALIGLVAWAINFKRFRVLADTPTSKIASAAQGYVELTGISSREYLAVAGLSSMPCVWFKCVTYERDSEGEWREINKQVSESSFAINDDTGTCLIDPDHAEVMTTHTRTWIDGQYKYHEEQLKANERIYVLGEFSTIGGAATDLSLSADVSALLADWKKDTVTLHQRFDLDGDGQINMQEWELARRAAQREIEQQHREIRLQPGVHLVRAPRDGRHFLISNLSPSRIGNRYLRWCAWHLLVFVVAVAMVGGQGWGLW